MTTNREICIVFADVSGSTSLYEKLGDAGALAAVERCVEAMRRATLLNKGRVVKTIGDEVMAVFDDAARGMQAVVEMQQRIDDLPPLAAGVKLAIRVGFHYGPALLENDDVFGDTVNTASRLASLAKAGQIITTAETVATLPGFLQPSCREIDTLTVRGKAGGVRICEVIWQEGVELTMLGSLATPTISAESQLRLNHGNDELVMGPARPEVTLGRDPSSDIVVRDPRASRSHARIEHRRGKFVLIDISSNGTHVTFQGEAEIALKREELILRGSGRIAFGHAWSADQAAETLRFSVES